MRGSGRRGIRLTLVIGLLALGIGEARANAHVWAAPQAAATTRVGQSTDVLIYEGKILPIITDVYTSISALGTAFNDRSVDEVAKVGDQFTGEQLRFDAVKPVPKALRSAAATMSSSLHNMANGTKAFVSGLRASDSAGAQRASTQITQGLKQFQQAVTQVRSLAGPLGEPTAQPGNTKGTPAPTPIIKGLG